MSEHQTKLGPDQIQFHEWCEPPLDPGDYTIAVDQIVDELGDHGTYTNTLKFSVAGPRFSLSPADIYSVYPPKGGIGDYAGSLPHVVFTRRTLPWERSIDPPRQKGDRLPWMAVFVFSADDFTDNAFPKLDPKPVGELINPGAGFIGPQIDKLADYESEADLCTTIDLDWALFQSVAPSATSVAPSATTELEYLAHVREVNTDHKETQSFLADGWFSVVLANRFPKPEEPNTEPAVTVENRAYLVSLEGMKAYLPGANSSASSGANKTVRLAVLSSWSFHCREAFTFKASMDNLHVRRLAVPWEIDPNASTKLKLAETQVHDAYQRGYTALNHSTRLGEETVSWYRGPLTPLHLDVPDIRNSLSAADAALRYDPTVGMMEVNYAAAFQLGRLLALQDRHFTTALHSYRNEIRRHMNEVAGNQRAQSVLGLINNDENDELMSLYRQTVAGRADKATPANGRTDDHTIPKAIGTWLAKLLLLYRVPFTYLVPDERMLPPDSMRFFHLDPNWISLLLQGACSIGRKRSAEDAVDIYLRHNLLKIAFNESRTLRRRDGQKQANDEKGQEIPENSTEQTDWRLTGFLMRSPVVTGWQGLEMRAWSDSGATIPLTPLRIDRLAPDIMLCIFLDQVMRIEVKQPPEGMHFGAAVVTPQKSGNAESRGGIAEGRRDFSRNSPQDVEMIPAVKEDLTWFYKHSLRRLNDTRPGYGTYDEPKDGIPAGPGHQLKDSSVDHIPMRTPHEMRVVDVSTLVTRLEKKLNTLEANVDTKFTSAAFGVEMVEAPGKAVFDVTFEDESEQ